MAVEFRCRAWFTNEQWRRKTFEGLQRHGVGWVAADELAHETFHKERCPSAAGNGGSGSDSTDRTKATKQQKVLPIAMEITTPDFFYVRVHRRYGFEDRRLGEEEIEGWRRRLVDIRDGGKVTNGNIFFLWGTDHKNVPFLNAAALLAAVPRDMRVQWEAPKGTIESMFSKVSRSGGVSRKVGEEKKGEASPTSAAAGIAEHKVEKKPKKERGIKRFFSQV